MSDPFYRNMTEEELERRLFSDPRDHKAIEELLTRGLEKGLINEEE